MSHKPVRVGIDFDGVLAYNPFRIARAPVTYVKRHLLGVRKTKFYIPKTGLEKFIWAVLHESSIFPARGMNLLKKSIQEKRIEAHLVTARFAFLQPALDRWLTRHQAAQIFTSITMNEYDEQPHMYKARIVAERKFDYFIEDNFDIVSHIAPKSQTRILWIYNILDRTRPYEWKYPYLEKALEEILGRFQD